MAKSRNSAHREEMFRLIEACYESGLSKKAFCKREGINPQVFYYWQKRYRQRNQDDSSSFHPISIKPEASANAPLEINYPNGVVIRLNGQFDLSRLHKLIHLF